MQYLREYYKPVANTSKSTRKIAAKGFIACFIVLQNMEKEEIDKVLGSLEVRFGIKDANKLIAKGHL